MLLRCLARVFGPGRSRQHKRTENCDLYACLVVIGLRGDISEIQSDVIPLETILTRIPLKKRSKSCLVCRVAESQVFICCNLRAAAFRLINQHVTCHNHCFPVPYIIGKHGTIVTLRRNRDITQYISYMLSEIIHSVHFSQ